MVLGSLMPPFPPETRPFGSVQPRGTMHPLPSFRVARKLVQFHRRNSSLEDPARTLVRVDFSRLFRRGYGYYVSLRVNDSISFNRSIPNDDPLRWLIKRAIPGRFHRLTSSEGFVASSPWRRLVSFCTIQWNFIAIPSPFFSSTIVKNVSLLHTILQVPAIPTIPTILRLRELRKLRTVHNLWISRTNKERNSMRFSETMFSTCNSWLWLQIDRQFLSISSSNCRSCSMFRPKISSSLPRFDGISVRRLLRFERSSPKDVSRRSDGIPGALVQAENV